MNHFNRWDPKAAPARLLGQSFATMDPGREGAVLAFDANGTYLGWAPAIQPLDVLYLYRQHLWDVWIIETQYANNPKLSRSANEVAFTSGITVGAVLSQGGELDLVEVSPATWQAWLTKKEGVMKEKGSGIKAAMARAEQVFPDREAWSEETKAQRTGLAAAWGMAEWWLDKWL